MIFLPSISILINGSIIFFCRIFKREFGLSNNFFGRKLISYLIILAFAAFMAGSLFYIFDLTLNSGTNLQILTTLTKEAPLIMRSEAASMTIQATVNADEVIISHLPLNSYKSGLYHLPVNPDMVNNNN